MALGFFLAGVVVLLLVVGTIIFLAMKPGVSTIGGMKTPKQPTTQTGTNTPKKSVWENGWRKMKDNWQVVASIVALHILLLLFFYDGNVPLMKDGKQVGTTLNWYATIFWHWLFWLDQAVVILAFLFLREMSKDKNPKLEMNGWGVSILLVLIVGNIFFVGSKLVSRVTTAMEEGPNTGSISPEPVVAKPLSPPVYNKQGEAEVRTFWGSKNYTQEEVEEMVEIGRRESQFNQFETDGSPLRGRENPQDVGIYQINEGWWLSTAQALSLDIYTLEGNLEMADYIRRHHGADEWNTSEIARMTARRKAFVIDAPPNAWSERVPTVGSTSFTPSGPVWITTNRGGDPISLVPGEVKNIGDTTWTRFSSQSSEAVQVTVKRE